MSTRFLRSCPRAAGIDHQPDGLPHQSPPQQQASRPPPAISTPTRNHPVIPSPISSTIIVEGYSNSHPAPKSPLHDEAARKPSSKPKTLKFKVNKRKGKPSELVENREKAAGTDKEVDKESDDSLPPNTICCSQLLKKEDLALMPNLDGTVLTRAQRRMSTTHIALVERTLPLRRPSTNSSHQRDKEREGKALPNGINGTAYTNGESSSISSGIIPGAKTTEALSPKSIAKKQREKERERDKERNIDNVVFGNVTFKAWYPSWYPKEILGEKALNGDASGIVVGELYVCKKCFGYGKVVTEWVRHCRVCEREVPGEKVYTHGKEGTWSIWVVDGGEEIIFCQKLSLFAKLFLDNKSVFFDVSGFNYFLLVHTSSTTGAKQIVGFFSKEKMSWDNNNLACILIFPPWQRKSLGTLLMGVSYEISRREKILGGPEKPISDLGKKGYARFWGAEIARWLLECKDSDRKKNKGLITVADVSQGTWIEKDDCLRVLRDMGVVELASKGKGEVERVRIDKVAVRSWIDEQGLRLERAVDTEGFVEGYAVKKEEGGEVEEMGD